MKIWQVTKNYILYNKRLPVNLFMMILFPIALITILGLAFGSVFETNSVFNKLRLEYKFDTTKKDVIDKNKEYFQVLKDKLDIDLIETTDIDSSIKKVKDRDISALLEIKDNELKVVINNVNEVNNGLIKSLFDNYIKDSKVYMSIFENYPQKAQNISTKRGEYTNDNSIVGDRKLSSIDYYSVLTMLQMGLYASIGVIFAVYTQKKLDVLKRIGLSGLSTFEYMTGTILGNMIVGGFELFILFLYTKFVLKAYWGNNIFLVLLIFISLLFFISSVGVSIGISFKNEVLAALIPQVIIPVFAFLGGAYFPLNLGVIQYISPIYWLNKSIMAVLYGYNLQIVVVTIFVNIAVGTFFYIFAILKTRKVVFA